MKVLVLTTTFPRWRNDPTPAFVYDLSKRLKNEGLEIVVLAPHYEGAKFYEKIDGLKVYRFPYFYPTKYQKLCYEGGILPNLKRSWLARIQVPFLFLAELVFAFRIIRKEKINTIHSHWIVPSGLIGGIISKVKHIPHVTTAHAGDVFTVEKSKFLIHISRFIFQNSQKVTVNSTFTKESINRIDENLSDSKIEVIPMGADTEIFKPIGDKLDSFHNNKIIFSIGRLVEKKGFEYLIKAMPLVIREIPTTKLIIGGTGPEESKLKNLVNILGLERDVIFIGYIKTCDLPKYYRTADVFVLPSVKTKEGDTEGLGIVLLEAMACGTPVIGSNIGGITDIIEDGKNGLLIESKNPKDIAEKIIKIISGESLITSFSENGLKTIKERFLWEVIINKFIDIYKGLSPSYYFYKCTRSMGNSSQDN